MLQSCAAQHGRRARHGMRLSRSQHALSLALELGLLTGLSQKGLE